jgi:hypothetical protein
MTGPAVESHAAVHSVGLGLINLLIGAAACLLIPLLAARTLPGATPPRQYTINSPVTGVLQDSFVVLILSISAGWVPNFFLAHVKGTNNWWGVVFFYLALMGDAYRYVMRNNLGHVRRERARVAAQAAANNLAMTAEDNRALTGLARHVRRQNVIALGPLIPLILLVIPGTFGGLEEGGLSQLFMLPPEELSSTVTRGTPSQRGSSKLEGSGAGTTTINTSELGATDTASGPT